MKDLTKIKTPFGLLGKKTRKALRAHFEVGGEIQWWDAGTWYNQPEPFWHDHMVYRAKPADPITSNIDLSVEYREFFEAVQDRAEEETQPHPIFAAVKQFQETEKSLDINRHIAAHAALMAIKVPE